MNAKSKVFGLLAAIGLTMSMFAGVAAQSSDYEWVGVELTDSGGYICGIDIFAIGGNFGTWDFNGSQYVESSGASTIDFWGNVVGGGVNGCDVSISFGGLSNWNTGEWIDPYNFTAYSVHQGAVVDPWGFGNSGVFYTYDFSYTLNSVPNVSAGLYDGTISAFVANTP